MSDSKKYNDIIKSWEVPAGLTEDQAWERLQGRMASTQTETKVIPMRRWWVGVAAAAAVISAIVLLWPSSVEKTLVATAKGEMRTVTLPDGSTAILNGGSSLSFNNDWSEGRELSMEGQVFYQVKKGSAFTVHAPNGDVQVLGTSFDVASRENYFHVKCETGKVKVTIEGDAEIITPGEEVFASNHQLEKKTFDNAVKSWRAGELQFNEERLSDVWMIIENQFGVQITAPKSDTRHFNGTVSATNLTEALQTVCLAMNLNFELKGEHQVVITQK